MRFRRPHTLARRRALKGCPVIIAAKQTLQHADVHQAGQDADFLFVRKKKGSETLSFSFPTECLLWVISRPFATTLRMSAFGGKADIGVYTEKKGYPASTSCVRTESRRARGEKLSLPPGRP